MLLSETTNVNWFILCNWQWNDFKVYSGAMCYGVYSVTEKLFYETASIAIEMRLWAVQQRVMKLKWKGVEMKGVEMNRMEMKWNGWKWS